jgi:hypothetical protein
LGFNCCPKIVGAALGVAITDGGSGFDDKTEKKIENENDLAYFCR